MAKILGTDSIRNSIPKMVELKDEFVINGQVYNKSNMTPKPFQTLAFQDVVSGLLDPIMYDSIFVTNTKTAGTVPRNSDSIVVDNINPDVTYVLSSTNTTSTYLFKITKSNSNYKLERILVLNGVNAYYGGSSKIICQDDDYVYVFTSISSNDSYAYNNRITQINKTSMSIISTNLSRGRSSVIYNDNVYIYIAAIGENGSLKIDKYSKDAVTLSTIYTGSPITNSYSIKMAINSCNVSDDTLWFYYFVDVVGSDLQHRFTPKKCVINMLTNQVDILDVEIDFNNFQTELILPAFTNNQTFIFEKLTILSNDGMYISLMPYTIGPLVMEESINYIYTFKSENNNEKLKLVSMVKLPMEYKALLSFNNNNSVIFANDCLVTFFKWDDSLKLYKETGRYQDSIAFVSRDMNNTIWIQNKDTSVEQFSPTIPTEICVQFEGNNYEYINDDINTKLLVYCKNFNNEYITSNLTLTLTGNIKFAMNGLKTLTISTTNSGVMEIPVIITGASLIGVNTFLI